MIITRTPLRISLFGGGSDLPAYWQTGATGSVVSLAIDKYVYVAVNRKFDGRYRVSYSRTENVDDVSEIQHELARECLRLVPPGYGVEITSVGDVPGEGTGLGSSSAFTVGLLRALHLLHGEYPRPERLAQEACEIEIDHCGKPIGYQDQYIASLGGCRRLTFNPDGSVSAQRWYVPARNIEALQQYMLLLYTGITRRADDVLRESAPSRDTLREMAAQCDVFEQLLNRGQYRAIGRLLLDGWLLKRSTGPRVSTPEIDALYERAMAAGAWGGKLLGAGGGGFLLFLAPIEAHAAIVEATGLLPLPFGLADGGCQVIWAGGLNLPLEVMSCRCKAAVSA